jgi:hypothetical protein
MLLPPVFRVQAYESWLMLSKLTRVAAVQPHEGWLKKLKRTPPALGSSWNRRYFRLNPAELTLEYFTSKPRDKDKDQDKDKRTILLSKITCVRSIDPWTFQLEVKCEEWEREGEGGEEGAAAAGSRKKLAKQSSSLQSGSMSYFCLQARTQDEQVEWKSILEMYLMDLMVSGRGGAEGGSAALNVLHCSPRG